MNELVIPPERTLQELWFRSPFSEMNQSAREFLDAKNFPITRISGTLLITLSYQFHIPHFVEYMLPLIHESYFLEKMKAPAPFRLVPVHKHPFDGDMTYQIDFLHLMLDMVNLDRPQTSKFELFEQQTHGRPITLTEDWFSSATPRSDWYHLFGMKPPSMKPQRHEENNYTACWDNIVIPTHRWYHSTPDSCRFRKYLYSTFHIKPVVYAPNHQISRAYLKDVIPHITAPRLASSFKPKVNSAYQPGDVLIIQRKHDRQIANLQELHDLVVRKVGAKNRVHIVNDFNGGLLDQMALLVNVRLVIAPHGAGLTNIVFMPLGSGLIEILPYGFNHDYYFKTLAENNGQVSRHYYLEDYSHTILPADCYEQFRSVAANLTLCNMDNWPCFSCIKRASTRVDLEVFEPLLREVVLQTKICRLFNASERL